ncbi:MAG: Hpt domain-containing protein [Treponema sp.]|nr:Hpt domain-containing protein [Treponema sp.]
MINIDHETGNKEGNSNHSPESIIIPGINTAKGVFMTGGKMTLYRQVLALFCKDAKDRLPLFQTIPNTDNLSQFVIHAHALKSASGSLGASELSAEAARLEAAGKAGNITFVLENMSTFAEHLSELVRSIDEALESTAADSHNEESSVSIQLLRELESALKSENDSEIDRILYTINEKPLDTKSKEIVEQISEQVLMFEFGNAIDLVRTLFEGAR